ncbi:MAG: DUF4340 domain-containing protein [Candidatus Eisenbacteria bacterium]|nr:DUF4340 domain-containing protein [Candidatus Eisenbacteria bacterium]
MKARSAATAAATILLLFLLIWLAAPILRVPRPGEEIDRLLPGFPAEPESLALSNDSLDAVLVPRDGSWMIIRPIKDWADSGEAHRILSLLEKAPVVRVVDPEPESGVPYGLEPPRATVRAGGRILRIGDGNPTGDGVYAAAAPSPAVLLAGKPFAEFPRIRLHHLRDRRPLHYPYRLVESLAFTRRGKTTTLLRVGKESWTVEEAGLRANERAAWRILAHLKDGRVHDWDRRGAYRAGDDPFTFQVRWAEGEASLTVGAAVPETALRTALASDREGTILLPRRLIDSLETWSGSFLDPLLFRGDLTGEETVEVEGPEGEFVIVREEKGWRLGGEGGRKADPSRTRAFLIALGRLKALRFLDPADAVAEGDRVLRVKTKSEEVTVERGVAGILVGRRAGERGALILEPNAAGVIGVGAEDLVSRLLFPEKIRGADKVRILFEGFTVEATREEGGWRLREPFPSAARPEAFETLLSRLAALRWVGRAPGERLDEPLVRIEAEGGGEKWTLRLGGRPLLNLAETDGTAGLLELPADASAWVPARLDHWRVSP